METYFMRVQSEFIKNYPNIKELFWGEDDEALYLGMKQNVGLIIIPKTFSLIDTEKLKNKFTMAEKEVIHSVLRENLEYVPAQITGSATYAGKEVTILNNSKRTVYVDTKLLKNFPMGISFSTSGERTNVRVYYNSTLLGIVMPIRVNR